MLVGALEDIWESFEFVSHPSTCHTQEWKQRHYDRTALRRFIARLRVSGRHLHVPTLLYMYIYTCSFQPQLNVLAGTEVHSITMAIPPTRQHGRNCVFNQLAHHRAVIASFTYTCNVCRHASKRQQSTLWVYQVTRNLYHGSQLVYTCRLVPLVLQANTPIANTHSWYKSNTPVMTAMVQVTHVHTIRT